MLFTRPNSSVGMRRWRHDTVITFHSIAEAMTPNKANAIKIPELLTPITK